MFRLGKTIRSRGLKACHIVSEHPEQPGLEYSAKKHSPACSEGLQEGCTGVPIRLALSITPLEGLLVVHQSADWIGELGGRFIQVKSNPGWSRRPPTGYDS